MSRQMGQGDQPDLGPNAPFAPHVQSQYPSTQLYQPQSEYPALDHQDLNMADQYPQPVQQNISQQFQDPAPVAPPRNGNTQGMAPTSAPDGMTGMAPPQTPQQPPFSPGGPRPSIDEASEAAEASGMKRKRSKVSRACDECRRKKVFSADLVDNQSSLLIQCRSNVMQNQQKTDR